METIPAEKQASLREMTPSDMDEEDEDEDSRFEVPLGRRIANAKCPTCLSSIGKYARKLI